MISWAETQVGCVRLELASGLLRRLSFTNEKPRAANRESFPCELVDAAKACSAGSGVLPFLDIAGTPFQRRVWKTLSLIPCGQTRTYREVAEAVAGGSYARAVATACSHNAIAVFIPCHRVVAKQGIGGYRWGAEVKRSMLKWEGQGGNTRDFFLSYWRL